MKFNSQSIINKTMRYLLLLTAVLVLLITHQPHALAKLSNKHKKRGEPKKKGFDPHKYEDIVFVYFRMNEHSEKEPHHLVNIVENEL